MKSNVPLVLVVGLRNALNAVVVVNAQYATDVEDVLVVKVKAWSIVQNVMDIERYHHELPAYM